MYVSWNCNIITVLDCWVGHISFYTLFLYESQTIEAWHGFILNWQRYNSTSEMKSLTFIELQLKLITMFSRSNWERVNWNWIEVLEYNIAIIFNTGRGKLKLKSFFCVDCSVEVANRRRIQQQNSILVNYHQLCT